MKTVYYNVKGSPTQSLSQANRIEMYDSASLYILVRNTTTPNTSPSPVKLRNTYQVPSGMQVVVNTPEGEKKYTGGQYVPPEQLANAHVTKAGSGSGGAAGGGGGQGEQQGDQQGNAAAWPEMSEQFKHIDPSQDNLFNKASYQLKPLIPFKIIIPHRVAPKVRFGVEFTAANLCNSLPILASFLEEMTLDVSDKRVVQQSFLVRGKVDVQNQQITLYDSSLTDDAALKAASYNVAYMLGFFVYSTLEQMINSLEQQKGQIEVQLKSLSDQLHSLYTEHAEFYGKPPQPKAIPQTNSLYQQIQELTLQKEQDQVLKPLLDVYKQAVNKECSSQDYPLEFAKTFALANVFSMGIGRTLDSGMEELSGEYPDTVSAARNILSAYEQLNTSDDQQAEQ